MIRKLGKAGPTDVVERGGRPVLRVPNTALFAPGEATLKPEGKVLLNQITLAINDQLDNFELRVVSYTDTDAESDADSAPKKDTPDKTPADADPKPHYATSWDLTAARAAILGRYYRDQTTLPFLNVLVVGRGDSEPIVPNAGDSHARNRRVEITITPMPVAFHPAPDADKANVAPTPAKTPPAEAATNTPAPVKKVKVKKPDTDTDKTKDKGTGR